MIKTLRIYLIAAAILAAGILFYTKAVAPGESRDSDVSISVPETPVEYTSSQRFSAYCQPVGLWQRSGGNH